MIKRALLACGIACLLGVVPAKPSWQIGIDSRFAPQWLAESPGRVFALRDSQVIAIDASSGAVLWTSRLRAAGAPAVAGRLLAVPIERGVAFLSATSGEPVRRIAFDETPSAVGSGNWVAIMLPNRGLAIGYDTHMREIWRNGDLPATASAFSGGGDAVVALGSDSTALVLDGRTGRSVAQATDVEELVGADGRYLWFTVSGGGLKGLDLHTNHTVSVHNGIVRNSARVEHGLAVAVVDGRLSTIDMNAGGSSKPLSIYGRWVGGPVDGRIFIERSDGMYVQSLTPGSHAHHVARYSGDSRTVTTDRRIGYVGLADGEVDVVDVHAEKWLQRLNTPCDFYEGFAASGSTALIHCDQEGKSLLIGFPRVSV